MAKVSDTPTAPRRAPPGLPTKSSTARDGTKRRRAIAAERPAARRVATVGGKRGSGETAALRARLTELESRNAALVDRLTWAIDRLGTIIEDLKAREATR